MIGHPQIGLTKKAGTSFHLVRPMMNAYLKRAAKSNPNIRQRSQVMT